MRVLVCGGRDLNTSRVEQWLVRWIGETKKVPTTLIHGGADGADAAAPGLARQFNIPCHEYKANWRLHGRAAGPIRNKQMLDEGQPDLVIAFPGSTGTANMVRQAIDKGVEVKLVEGDFK